MKSNLIKKISSLRVMVFGAFQSNDKNFLDHIELGLRIYIKYSYYIMKNYTIYPIFG